MISLRPADLFAYLRVVDGATRYPETFMCPENRITKPLRVDPLIFALATAFACCPALASAQGSAPSTVRQQLEIEARRFQQRGYSLVRPVIEGDLDDRQQDTIRVTLGGGSFAVDAACDQDCVDLDMKIIDDSGDVVATLADYEDPVLQLDTTRTAEYRIILSLTCRMDPCRYGIAIFARTVTR
jgi:hypothetical protein